MNKNETFDLKNEINMLQTKLASLSKNYTVATLDLVATNKKEISDLKNQINTLQTKTKQLIDTTKPCKTATIKIPPHLNPGTNHFQCQPGKGPSFKTLKSGRNNVENQAGCFDFCYKTVRCLAFDFEHKSKLCRLYATSDNPRLGQHRSEPITSSWCVLTPGAVQHKTAVLRHHLDTNTKLHGNRCRRDSNQIFFTHPNPDIDPKGFNVCRSGSENTFGAPLTQLQQ